MLPVPADEGELVDAHPASGALEAGRRPVTTLPAVQAAAAAAGGFVAGAAVVGLIGRRQRRAALASAGRQRGLRGRGRGAAAPDRLQIVGSRSLLLDVHLLGGSGTER
jgi:hypothetical protein